MEGEKDEKGGKIKKSVTDSTLEGLRVTLKSTLELHDFLYQNEGEDFKYLMTCRLNQDPLRYILNLLS